MARGKQKAAAQRRRDAADQASLDRLAAAILSEADKLRAAEQQVAETAGNADLLKARRAARDAAVAGEISRLGPGIAELESAAAEEEDLAERISDAWQGVTDTIMSGYRGGIEGLEDFLADVLDTSDSPMLREGVAGRRLSRERIAALQQARHIRHESFPLRQWDPDAHPVEQWLASQMDAHARSRALGRSWSAMAAWTATVTHDSVGGSALSPFGAVEELRLLYVAMTRATEMCLLTWANRRTGPTARMGTPRINRTRGRSPLLSNLPGSAGTVQDGPAFVSNLQPPSSPNP